MAHNDASSVSQCKCGTWFTNHPSGQCKVCRQRKTSRKPRKAQSRGPAWGTQEWAETRGDDLGESPDY